MTSVQSKITDSLPVRRAQTGPEHRKINSMNTLRCAVLLLFPLAMCPPILRAESPVRLINPGFEEGTLGWSGISEPMAKLTAEAAHSGNAGLRITDQSRESGSNVRSSHISVTPGKPHAVRFYARTQAGARIGIYLDYFDSDGTMLTTHKLHNQIIYSIPDKTKSWKQFTIVSRALENAAAMTVWIHSFNGSLADADLDDFSISALTEDETMTVKTSPPPEHGGTSQFPTPDPERITQIAAMLPEKPKGLGSPASDRTFWNPLKQHGNSTNILERAEKFRTAPPPETPDEMYLEFTETGNRTNYQRPYRQCATRINALVVAECLENKGRFLAAIERDMLNMCEQRSWVMPAHDKNLTNFHGQLLTVDLGSSARAWMLANALYWLEDRLQESTRNRIFSEIDRRVLQPYLNALRAGTTLGNWWIRGSNNWNAVCSAGVVGTALALVESAETRAEFLAGMEISNRYFLAGFTEDGYCSEGVGYWNYGFGHYMMMGIQVKEATGGALDIFQHPKLRAIASFPLNILIQSKIAPAFADCSIRARPAANVLAMIDRVFPDIIPGTFPSPSPVSANIVATGLNGSQPVDETGKAAVQPEFLATYSWFPNAGILISRDDPDAETPFSAAIKGGHNAEHHNHNDVGSYAIVLDGDPLLLDPGGEVYTRRTFSSRRYESKVLNSYGHPVPVIGGKLQSKGRNSTALILETDFGDDANRLTMDIADAYPVDSLTSLIRRFEHDRKNQTVVIEDRVSFDEPTDFETCLITSENALRQDENTIVVYNEARALQITVTVKGSPWEYTPETIENPGRVSPARLSIALTEPVLNASVRFAIRPVDPPQDPTRAN